MARQPHLRLEGLEERCCPSITLNVQVLPGHQVLLTGTVDGAGGVHGGAGPLAALGGMGSAGMPVTFSGAVSGSASTDLSGNFSFLTSAASLGTVYAADYDASTSTSEFASATIAVNAPSLALSITGATANTVTLSGSVAGLDLAGDTVTLQGAASDSVVTDSNGNFSVTETLATSGAIQVSATDLWGQSSTAYSVAAQTVSAGSTPQLALDVLMLPGQKVQLAGVVTGSNAGGAVVSFSGAASGTAQADAKGFYSFTTASASLGKVQASAVDSAQQATNVASAQIALAGPTITLNVVASTADTVTFSGNLADLDAANETILISGASVGSVVTDANGDFTFTTAAADLGMVSVSATDFWGQASNSAEVDLADGAPVITNFAAIRIFGNTYEFQGSVTGAAQGQTINFGGLPSLNGQTTTVAANGSFLLSELLQAGEIGAASAQTTNAAGQASNIATAVVS